MNTKSNHLIEWLLTLLLIISILINVGWFIFRYGGHYYYMKISSSTGTSQLHYRSMSQLLGINTKD